MQGKKEGSNCLSLKLPITSTLTDGTKIQVFICSASPSLSCDCLRKMRNNADDHGQQKQLRRQRKKQPESRLGHNTTSVYPAFLTKLFFTFATKMEGGVYSSHCIKKEKKNVINWD